MSPARPCLRCGALTHDGSYCRRHRPHSRRHPGRVSGGRAATFRRAVLAPSGGRCAVCGSAENVEAHHVRPISEGGSSEPPNGLALCRAHHLLAHMEATERS